MDDQRVVPQEHFLYTRAAMKFNIENLATDCQKKLEIDDDQKLYCSQTLWNSHGRMMSWACIMILAGHFSTQKVFEVLRNSVNNYTIEMIPDDRNGVLQQGKNCCMRKNEGTTGGHAPLDDNINVCCKVPIL